MAKTGTTASTAAKFKAASTSGVRHGPSNKNVQSTASPKGVHGKGTSGSTTSPIKGPSRGGV